VNNENRIPGKVIFSTFSDKRIDNDMGISFNEQIGLVKEFNSYSFFCFGVDF